MHQPIFIDHPNGRLYEVVEVAGYPRTERGDTVRCHVDHGRQRIEVTSHVRGAQRNALIERACGGLVLQIVPMVGQVA